MYRKFTASHIFNGYNFLSACQVLITNNAGVVLEVIDKTDAGDGIESFNGILCPGFINAHCHLELSHLKEVIPEKTGLVEFVQQVMRKRETNQNNSVSLPDCEELNSLKETAMKNAEKEMYNSGTVAVGDICNTSDSIIIKESSKLRWHNFIEASGFTDAKAPLRMADSLNLFTEFITKQLNKHTTLSPHAPYSVSKTLFSHLNTLTAKQLITLHNQECAAENELYLNKSGGFLSLYKNFGIDISAFAATGKSSLQSWLPYFSNNQSVILVHNTFISEDDIAFAHKHYLSSKGDLFYCLCINANKYIEDRTPPIKLLRKNNCKIVLGTDSYASNHQLNLFEEIKTIYTETNGNIKIDELLQWATSNGANALQMQDTLGSFEKGKQPGIVLIENVENLIITDSSSARRIL